MALTKDCFKETPGTPNRTKSEHGNTSQLHKNVVLTIWTNAGSRPGHADATEILWPCRSVRYLGRPRRRTTSLYEQCFKGLEAPHRRLRLKWMRTTEQYVQ